jgi:hypothetical protein
MKYFIWTSAELWSPRYHLIAVGDGAVVAPLNRPDSTTPDPVRVIGLHVMLSTDGSSVLSSSRKYWIEFTL